MAEKEKDQAEAEVQEGKKKKGRPFLMILLVIVVLILAGVGAGAYFFFFSAPSDEKLAAQIAQDETKKATQAAQTGSMGVTVDLEPFVVNLADPRVRHFLKVSITIELTDESAKSDFEKRIANIRNDILLLMSSKTLEEIITLEGKIRLRDEIAARVGRIVGHDRILNVYFSQFVVQ